MLSAVGSSAPSRQIMENGNITPYASQPRIVIATFKCNTTSDFPRRPQCLVPPIALSTGRRWNTPRDAAANWYQRFELRVWPQQRLLANDLQANYNYFFFYWDDYTSKYTRLNWRSQGRRLVITRAIMKLHICPFRSSQSLQPKIL
jgi:hypothetical protein